LASIQPKGENLKEVVKWISSERHIHQAALRIHFSPKNKDYLKSFDGKGG
jgi:hypothetical protein